MKSFVLLLSLLCSSVHAQWERVREIPDTRTVYALLAVNDTLFAGTDSLVYVGSHGGSQWFSGAPPVSTPDAIGCMVKSGGTLVIGTFQHGIFRTTDDGLSWQPFSNGLTGAGAMDISSLLVRRDSLIAGTLGAGVFITKSDFGHSWTAWGDSLADYQGENVFRMLAAGTTVFAGAGANGYMFRYTDIRPWWDPVPMSTPRRIGEPITGIASGSATLVAATPTRVYRSTDDGVSWDHAAVFIPPLTFAVYPLYHDSTFLAIASSPLSSTLLKSSDRGTTWASSEPFPIPNVFDAAIVGETLFLGQAGGLWKASLSRLLTSVEPVETIPSGINLLQNYPNPFNPSTTISYILPDASFVTLTVYNLLGQTVARLVSEDQGPGSHHVVFMGDGLPGGVYVYRIQAGNLTVGGKMLLVK